MKGDGDDTFWTIEINSLEGLIKLASETTDIIVSKNGSLEIYDDYRE